MLSLLFGFWMNPICKAQEALKIQIDFFDLRPLGQTLKYFITPGFHALLEDPSPVPVLTLHGHPDNRYRIDVTSQLQAPQSWKELGEVEIGADPFILIDLQGRNQTSRIYRTTPILVNPQPDQLVWIPPGTFDMGSPFDEQDHDTDENPMTRVTLTHGYWMGKYEVTQKAFMEVMGYNPSRFAYTVNHPVENVTWEMAMEFCQKLTTMESASGMLPEGFVYRLPTEAEWEYACRAGTKTRYPHGDDPDFRLFEEFAWHSGNSPTGTHQVGILRPNPWGLYGMLGGVYEWCLGWHARYPGGEVTDYISPVHEDRVMRGGAWSDHPRNGRSAERHWYGISKSYGNAGFRVVLGHPYPLAAELNWMP